MADVQETSFDANVTTESNEDMEVVTMVDVLKEEQEREEDACAVLGGSDEKNCTYSKGYLKRQALYACVTCIPQSKEDPLKRAGICLACSYSCHEGHDLIELYTKRNFRCDCGNSRFSEKKCNLDCEKIEFNDQNTYNHNFSGLYCTCERPYPDPEDNIADEMIQCIICEDWYHCRHLGVRVPPMNSYVEMICFGCVSKHEFLLNYTDLTISSIMTDETANKEIETIETREIDTSLIKIENESEIPKDPEEQQEPVNMSVNEEIATAGNGELDTTHATIKVENESEVPKDPEQEEQQEPENISMNGEIETVENDELGTNLIKVENDSEMPKDPEQEEQQEPENIPVNGEIETVENNEISTTIIKVENNIDVPKDAEQEVQQEQENIPVEESQCKMPKIKSDFISAKFWIENWRQQLCTCNNCLQMYETENVTYLTDIQDTVHFYEEKGKAKALENASESQYEQGLKALSTLDRVKQVEAISEYNAMKEQLKEYLQKFAENKKVVREEDIKEFFSKMASRKKQKVDVPYFCR